jgi:hypothetical protein
VRSGDWKLHVPHTHRHQNQPAGKDGRPAGESTEKQELALYNLKDDPSEKINVAAQNPKVVARLIRLLEIGRREYGDSATKTMGSKMRAPGAITGTRF